MARQLSPPQADGDDHGRDDEEMDGDEAAEQAESGGKDVPDERSGLSARQIFNLLKGQYSNTASLAADLFQEEGLQEKLRVIAGSLRPLHREYTYDFEMHKGGQQSMMTFFALRSDFHYYECVAQIVESMQDPIWVQTLDLNPRPGAEQHLPPADDMSVAMKADSARLQVLCDFNMHLASNRCWSQAFYCFLLPFSFAGIYHPNAERRQIIMDRLSEMATALLDLEDYLSEQKDRYAQQLLEDLSTNRWQLTREILLQGEACNWDPCNRELQRLAWAIFAGPGSTKDVLEQVFNWLKDGLRSSKGKTLSGWTKFLYILTSPYTAASGIRTLLPSIADFSDFLLQNPSPDKEISALHPFHALSKDLDKELFPDSSQSLPFVQLGIT